MTSSTNNSPKALLLCGGKGERLRPFTESIPKPILLVGEKPILYYIIKSLEKFGVSEFVIATGYRSEKIQEYLIEEHPNLNYQIVDSGDADIIERIKDSSEFLSDNFIMCYGDTLSDVNIGELLKEHNSHEKDATVTVWPLQNSFGVMELGEDGSVTSYREKPVMDNWINIGYFCFNKSILNEVKKFRKFEDFLYHLTSQNQLNGYKHTGVHITVNTLHELNEAKENIKLIDDFLRSNS